MKEEKGDYGEKQKNNGIGKRNKSEVPKRKPGKNDCRGRGP